MRLVRDRLLCRGEQGEGARVGAVEGERVPQRVQGRGRVAHLHQAAAKVVQLVGLAREKAAAVAGGGRQGAGNAVSVADLFE